MKFIKKASILVCTSILLLISCNKTLGNNSSSTSISISNAIIEEVNSSTTSSNNISSNTINSQNTSYSQGLEGDPILTNEVAKQYYRNISKTSTGNKLIVELYNLIHPKKCKTSYSAIWDYLPYCDANPNNPNSDDIIAFYRGTPGKKGSMNKEHVWPSSRGGKSIEGDPHMVRPTFTSDNSGRGNDFYNESPTSYDPNEFGAAQYRGIAARIIFYCAVQEYQKLTLVDKTTDKTISRTEGTMGKLSTLLKWNLEYPIDETEILRNEVLSGARKVKGISFSFNRNPFIDDRSLACRIWGNTNSETLKVCSSHM